jgi:hypothetical protein
MKCKLLANQKLLVEAAKSDLVVMPDGGFFMRCCIFVQLRKGTVDNVIHMSYSCICHLVLSVLINVIQ